MNENIVLAIVAANAVLMLAIGAAYGPLILLAWFILLAVMFIIF